MAKFQVTGPDGGTYEITAPDDASEADILAYAQRNAGMVKAPEMRASTPPAVSPRQAEDESMAALDKYKGGPEATMQSLPKGLRVPLQTLRDSVTGIGQGLTFNFGDEAQAALATPLEMIRNKTMDAGASYDSALANARGEQKLAETRSPIANTIGQVAGGLAGGGSAQQGGLTLLNAARPTIGSMALRGAGEGAAYGALYGAGQGEGAEDRLGKAVKQGGLGALTGGVMGGIAGRSAQKAANAIIPTTDQLKTAGNNAYKAVDQAGVVLEQRSFGHAVDDIAIAAKQAGLDKTIHPKATAAMERLVSEKGKQPAMGEVDLLRRVLKSAASSNERDERRIANIMIGKLDDYVNGLKAADVVAGDPIKAVSALNKARDIWKRMSKSELIESAVTRAERRAASAGSGGNVDNAIRQNIRSILDKRGNQFTAEERQMMEKVVRGSPVQNLARLVGKLSPSGNGLMMTIHGIGGYASGGATLPLAGVGYGAKKFADSATPRNVDALSRVIRSGGSLPQPQLLPAQQRALLAAMIRGGGQGLFD